MKLSSTEYAEFRKLKPEPGYAVKFWRRIGAKYDFDFFPSKGHMPSVRVVPIGPGRGADIEVQMIDRTVLNPNVEYIEEEYD